MRKINEIKSEMKRHADLLSQDPKNQESINALRALMEELDTAELAQRAQQRLAGEQLSEKEKSAGRKFSMLRAIQGTLSGNLDGLERDIIEQGRKERSSMGLAVDVNAISIPAAYLRMDGNNATDTGKGKEAKAYASLNYFDALRDELVLSKYATFLSDLVGVVPFVKGGNVSAGWGAEGAEATATNIAFTRLEMTPKRNFINVPFTQDFLRQTSLDVEALIRRKFIEAHAALLESAAFNGTGSNNQPKGVLTAVDSNVISLGTNGGAINWKSVVSLESTIAGKVDVGAKMAYITNAKVAGAMKTIERVTGCGYFILDERMGSLNGYQLAVSNAMPSNLTKGSTSGSCSAMAFGDWSKMIIGSWGGIDIVVDPYTLKNKGMIDCTLNAYNDVLVEDPAAFAVIKDITIA